MLQAPARTRYTQRRRLPIGRPRDAGGPSFGFRNTGIPTHFTRVSVTYNLRNTYWKRRNNINERTWATWTSRACVLTDHLAWVYASLAVLHGFAAVCSLGAARAAHRYCNSAFRHLIYAASFGYHVSTCNLNTPMRSSAAFDGSSPSLQFIGSVVSYSNKTLPRVLAPLYRL